MKGPPPAATSTFVLEERLDNQTEAVWRALPGRTRPMRTPLDAPHVHAGRSHQSQAHLLARSALQGHLPTLTATSNAARVRRGGSQVRRGPRRASLVLLERLRRGTVRPRVCCARRGRLRRSKRARGARCAPPEPTPATTARGNARPARPGRRRQKGPRSVLMTPAACRGRL